MKKGSAFVILFFGFCTTSNAQLEKMKSGPAYDNVHKERILRNSHVRMDQKALMDKTEKAPDSHLTYDNMVTLSGNKQDGSLFKVQPTANYHNRYDIKKVTFPAGKK